MRYTFARRFLMVSALLFAVALLLSPLMIAAAPATATAPAFSVKVFSGITTAQASGPVRNIHQTMHLVTVVFPSEVAQVNNLQVRLEASFDQTLWFPISSDITTAPLVGSQVYQVEKAYGPWPYIRVRSLQNTGTKAMDVYYSGSIIPTVSAIIQATDRFLL